MSKFSAPELIIIKRERGRLSAEQIEWLVAGFTAGSVANEQMSAMAMAILLNGMDAEETYHLTSAMLASGERLNFDWLDRPTVDKHSTGGVGDKLTLILAPLVACFGVAMPQLSGRGLGHTGGTLDKLESIAGWRASLTNAEIMAQMETVGAVICAANSNIAPADRKLYALRDVTGTVESIPLIVGSIMSKKLAEGTANLFLDVKFGSGAFMKSAERAAELASALLEVGKRAGVNTEAVLTDMNTPLGRAAGNALEVAESVEVLSGGGPADVREISIELAWRMLTMAGKPVAASELAGALDNGVALEKWRQLIAAQGGDPSAQLPRAKFEREVRADRSGFVTELDAMAVGVAAWRLGAGRALPGEAVSFGAGVRLWRQLGEEVRAGEVLLTLAADDESRFDWAMAGLPAGIRIEASPPPPRQLYANL